MKILTLPIMLLSLTVANAVQAGKPTESYVFETEFDGAVSGYAISEPTNILGNNLNIVFNRSYSVSDFTMFLSEFGPCFVDSNGVTLATGVTMQLYQNYVDADLTVARFWFHAPDQTGNIDDVKYVLSLFDTSDDPVWSGTFPPGPDEIITRAAESWAIGPTKKNVKSACSGEGDFDENDTVIFYLQRRSD